MMMVVMVLLVTMIGGDDDGRTGVDSIPSHCIFRCRSWSATQSLGITMISDEKRNGKTPLKLINVNLGARWKLDLK